MASEATSRRVWLASYALAYLALGGMLLVAVRQRLARSVPVEEPVRVIHAQPSVMPRAADPRLDVNAAAWYDLDRLPGIGEQLARRIVEYREARLQAWRQTADAGDDPPQVFTQPADLLPIKGIGPKLLDRMRPYLRFPGDPPPGSMPAPAEPDPDE